MRPSLLALSLGVCLSVGGCRTPPREPVPALQPLVLPFAERKLPSPDFATLPANPAPTPDESRYLRLSAEECRRAACERATLANAVLAAAAGNSPPSPFAHAQVAVDALRRSVAHELAAEARNRTAGGALELYYRLQEAELLADLLARSLAEIDDTVAAADKLAANGFSEAPEAFALRKSQLDLRAERVKLRAGVRRLNVELKPLLGLEAVAGNLLPADGVQVTGETLDAAQAVQRALATRGDLRAIRVLAAGLDKQTVDAVRQAVAGLLPPLGAITAAANTLAPGVRALLPFLERPDVTGVRRQLDGFLRDREAEVARDVTVAADDYRAQRERLAVGRQLVALETARLAELTVRRANGLPVEAEYRKTRLELLQAEREQLQAAFAWKQADVTLRKLMGLLCPEACCGAS